MTSSPLPEIPAIGYLTEVCQEHRQFLTSFGRFVRTEEGTRLIAEGEAQDKLYLVISGTLRVTTNEGSQATLLATLSEGDTIGEINVFDPDTASANVTAVDDGLIWSLTNKELEGLFDADPHAGISVMKGLLKQSAERIRLMNDKLLTNEKEVFFDFWNNQP